MHQMTMEGGLSAPLAPAASSCDRCDRSLRHPVSVQAGMGPVCRGRCRSREDADTMSENAYCSPLLATPEVCGQVICLRDDQGRLHFNIPRRHAHHSPTGWGWGYGGSGPADFALNILAHVIGPAPDLPPRPDESAPSWT